jgi:hypothetical protein
VGGTYIKGPRDAIDALAAELVGRGIEVFFDDLGRRCVTRDTARRLLAERAAAEERRAEFQRRHAEDHAESAAGAPGGVPRPSRARLRSIPGGAKKDLSAAQAKALLLDGTAPLDASSGDQLRHRLSRAGDRQINRVLHIMATVRLRTPTDARAYLDKRKADGTTSMQAMRARKRRLSDIADRRMLDDATSGPVTGPGGHRGTTTDSNGAGSHPHTGTSDKPLPGPARPETTPATAGLPSHSPARSRRPVPAPTRSRRQPQSA